MSFTEQDLASFKKIVETRHSCRGFKTEPISKDIIKSVLNDANQAASNCNTQPWNVFIISGDKLQALKDLVVKNYETNKLNEGSGDFTFDTSLFQGRIKENQQHQGKTFYTALNIERDDYKKRGDVFVQNLDCYNAPHLALLFLDQEVGDNVRVASDIGMYAQQFLLSLVAHGLAGIPQTIWGFWPKLVREFLGLPDNKKLLFGISFGKEDFDAPGNSFKMDRNPIDATVTWIE